MHILSDAAGLPLVVGVSAGNSHDLKPMVAGFQMKHAPPNGRNRQIGKLHADKAHDRPDLRKWLRKHGAIPRIARKASNPAKD